MDLGPTKTWKKFACRGVAPQLQEITAYQNSDDKNQIL